MRRQSGHSEPPPSAAIRVQTCSSELGWIALAWRGERLRALTFGHASVAAAVRALDVPAEALTSVAQGDREPLAVRLGRYAAGAAEDFRDVPVDLDDYTDFQRRVLQDCRRIAYGQTRTYAELAARAGSPGAARAVGQTMARNRLPLVIPCHRVIASGGGLGGYSAPAGLAMKRRLLRLEGRDKESR